MKKGLIAIALLAFVTGCGSHATNPGTTANASNGIALSAAGNTATQSSTGGSAKASANSTASSGSAASGTLDNSSMNTVATTLINQYINSHNDPTFASYKADAEKMFAPGLYNTVVQMAASGTDYNHPVQGTASIVGLQQQQAGQFQANATLVMNYKDGTSETHHYLFVFVQTGGNWKILLIR